MDMNEGVFRRSVWSTWGIESQHFYMASQPADKTEKVARNHSISPSKCLSIVTYQEYGHIMKYIQNFIGKYHAFIVWTQKYSPQ